MRKYELVLVLNSISEKDRKALIETIKKMLGDVKFLEENDWGSKALKYKIKGQSLGFYYDFIFETDKIDAGVEKKIINMDNVLRHLMIRQK